WYAEAGIDVYGSLGRVLDGEFDASLEVVARGGEVAHHARHVARVHQRPRRVRVVTVAHQQFGRLDETAMRFFELAVEDAAEAAVHVDAGFRVPTANGRAEFLGFRECDVSGGQVAVPSVRVRQIEQRDREQHR